MVLPISAFLHGVNDHLLLLFLEGLEHERFVKFINDSSLLLLGFRNFDRSPGFFFIEGTVGLCRDGVSHGLARLGLDQVGFGRKLKDFVLLLVAGVSADVTVVLLLTWHACFDTVAFFL